ncbi:hypothetical protein HNE_0550 [Hyphomonas neptunium ATCC 15444]|uniref:Uncharacterized protein n=1 Tax=Hyphomonas neptunium (strain ATCC 15444) TaxID=228405 RepID=Q0C4R4_HYPNA|nr:hypothetical protein HNE_0550 [Hyphomonas neptunium ATCC 15444]
MLRAAQAPAPKAPPAPAPCRRSSPPCRLRRGSCRAPVAGSPAVPSRRSGTGSGVLPAPGGIQCPPHPRCAGSAAPWALPEYRPSAPPCLRGPARPGSPRAARRVWPASASRGQPSASSPPGAPRRWTQSPRPRLRGEGGWRQCPQGPHSTRAERPACRSACARRSGLPPGRSPYSRPPRPAR